MSNILIAEQKYKFVWHLCSIISFLFVNYVHGQIYSVYFWLIAGKIDINMSRNRHAINKLSRVFLKMYFGGFKNKDGFGQQIFTLRISRSTCQVMLVHISLDWGCRFIVCYCCRKQRQGLWFYFPGTIYGNYLFKELIKWSCTLATSTPKSLGDFSKFFPFFVKFWCCILLITS